MTATIYLKFRKRKQWLIGKASGYKLWELYSKMSWTTKLNSVITDYKHAKSMNLKIMPRIYSSVKSFPGILIKIVIMCSIQESTCFSWLLHSKTRQFIKIYISPCRDFCHNFDRVSLEGDVRRTRKHLQYHGPITTSKGFRAHRFNVQLPHVYQRITGRFDYGILTMKSTISDIESQAYSCTTALEA